MSNRQLPPPVPASTTPLTSTDVWFVALTSTYTGGVRRDGSHAYQGSTVSSWQSVVGALPGVQEVWRIMGPTTAAAAYQSVQDHIAGRRTMYSCIRVFS